MCISHHLAGAAGERIRDTLLSGRAGLRTMAILPTIFRVAYVCRWRMYVGCDNRLRLVSAVAFGQAKQPIFQLTSVIRLVAAATTGHDRTVRQVEPTRSKCQLTVRTQLTRH